MIEKKLKVIRILQNYRPAEIDKILEPWVKSTIIVPQDYLGTVINLCIEKRGKQRNLNIQNNRAILEVDLPLNEIVIDFYDKLKSYSKGYASFDYQLYDYFEGDLVKLNILVNSETVDAFSNIVHKTRAETIGRRICNKLKDLIPRQNFQIPIQAAIYGKIIARETIKAFRKDVTAKLYGGDVSRKKKLLEKQKKEEKMTQFGNVEIPQTAFFEALKMEIMNKDFGEMAEWFKAHAWNACIGATLCGTNPLSAK